MGFLDFFLPDLQWQSMTPELVLLLFALLAPLVALWDTDRRGMRQFTLIGLGGSLLLTLGSLLDWHFAIPWINLDFTLQYQGSNLNGAFVVTYASQLFKLLFLAVAFLAVLGLGRPLKGRAEEDFGEFCSLILFAVLGMMVVASAQELITLLLGIEMTSLCSYMLAGFRRDRIGAEASLKYFVIGAISSGLMVFAISLLYGMAGTTSIPALATRITAHGAFDALSLIPIAMLVAGLGFKISAVPFHAWAPDVYSGSPAPVAGILAAGSKAMGFAAVFNVFLVGLVGVKTNWQLGIALVAAASMFVGNLVALQQTNIRRMLAFSSIAQAGYLLIAVAVGTSAQDGGVYAVGGGIFHLMVNAAMKLGAFLVVGALLYAGVPDNVADWKGMGRRAPLLAFAMAMFLLSMAGLPPLGGFASKFVLFSGAIDAGATQDLGWLVWLAVLAVLNSAISLYYYLRLLRSMYVDEGEGGRLDVPAGTVAAVLACLAFVFVAGFYPQPFLDSAFQAAQSLLGLAPVAATPVP
ncbi:MAG TPA: NADH-quinone oxidoreductase subunit N [Candidatus Thermoplasmatota archaeon]|nr:NADH-quinone oxidoreductase subunit N [Candidatus Thermoplasmatota archaeon]